MKIPVKLIAAALGLLVVGFLMLFSSVATDGDQIVPADFAAATADMDVGAAVVPDTGAPIPHLAIGVMNAAAGLFIAGLVLIVSVARFFRGGGLKLTSVTWRRVSGLLKPRTAKFLQTTQTTTKMFPRRLGNRRGGRLTVGI